MLKSRSFLVIIVGLVAVGASVALSFQEWSSPTHTAVSPENGPLATRLALIAGLGWTLIILGIGSPVIIRRRPLSGKIIMMVSSALLGGLLGFLAWFVISFMFSS